MSTLDELLARPFRHGEPEPHHVDLRVSEAFYDRDTDFDRTLASFDADRALLAHLLTGRYGQPEHKDIRPYFDGDIPAHEPGAALYAYLTDWFSGIDLWRAGTRGIVAAVGHYDKELPLQLMLVVGDLSARSPDG